MSVAPVPAVRLEGAEVRINGRRILGPIDLEVREAERWVLLGPNGGGKTTLLSLAGARRQPSADTVRVLGLTYGRGDIRTVHPRIGHSSHTLAEMLPPGMRVLDVVLTGRNATLVTAFQWFGDDDRRSARRRLEEVGCGPLADQPFAACSQGERQRILLARALFRDVELLILDEPAAGLDLPARESLIAAVEAAAMRPEPPTILMATHHLEEIPPSATHAALLREGTIVAAGPVEEVLTPALVQACFGIGVHIGRRDGRWWAAAARSRPSGT